MVTLTLVSLAIIVIYIAVMVCKRGIPASISETYYSLDHPKTFTACMVATALLLLPPALEACGENSQFLIFLGVIGMCITGLFPHFASEEKTLHYTGAAMLFLFSQIWVGCNFPWLLLLWVAWVGYVIYYLRKYRDYPILTRLARCHAAFWAEITVILNTYLTVMIGL